MFAGEEDNMNNDDTLYLDPDKLEGFRKELIDKKQVSRVCSEEETAIRAEALSAFAKLANEESGMGRFAQFQLSRVKHYIEEDGSPSNMKNLEVNIALTEMLLAFCPKLFVHLVRDPDGFYFDDEPERPSKEYVDKATELLKKLTKHLHSWYPGKQKENE